MKKTIIVASFLLAFLASVSLAAPTRPIRSRVPVMTGERYVFNDGSVYWVWHFAGRKFVNRIEPVTGKMKRHFL